MAITYASDLAGMGLPYRKLEREEREARERSENMRLGIEALAELLRIRKENLEKRVLGKVVDEKGALDYGLPVNEYKDLGKGYGPTERLFREMGLALYPTEEDFRKRGTTDVIERQTMEKSGDIKDLWRPGRMLDATLKGGGYAMDYVGKTIGGWLGKK